MARQNLKMICLCFPGNAIIVEKTGEEWYDLKFIGYDVFIEIDNKYEKYEVSALIKKEKEKEDTIWNGMY